MFASSSAASVVSAAGPLPVTDGSTGAPAYGSLDLHQPHHLSRHGDHNTPTTTNSILTPTGARVRRSSPVADSTPLRRISQPPASAPTTIPAVVPGLHAHQMAAPAAGTGGSGDGSGARCEGSGDGLSFRMQCGVVRTNCIDCLDRTNVAQFCIGRTLLRQQLAALSFVLASDTLEVASTLLMRMYEEMGTQLALQYGGSQAVSSPNLDPRWTRHAGP